MASPQKENGYTGIANELLEKIVASGLNGTEMAIILHIIRKTYGFQKKQDEISLSQFMKAIPVSKPTVCNALNNLQLVKILKLVKKGSSLHSSNLWAFNKNYDEWQLVKKSKLVKKTKRTSKENLTQLVKKPLHTKETIQKKYTKERVISKDITPIDYELSKLLIQEIRNNLPTFKEPNLDSWANHVSRMRRLDKRTPEQIEYLIKWCQQDSFWQGNILSTQKLREKFDTLTAQVKRNNSNNLTIIE